MADKLLTRREGELVGLLTQGNTLRECARVMVIEYSTAAMHAKSARRKVGVQTSRQLALWALGHRAEWERNE